MPEQVNYVSFNSTTKGLEVNEAALRNPETGFQEADKLIAELKTLSGAFEKQVKTVGGYWLTRQSTADSSAQALLADLNTLLNDRKTGVDVAERRVQNIARGIEENPDILTNPTKAVQLLDAYLSNQGMSGALTAAYMRKVDTEEALRNLN